ncbi:MAG: hypothetical protein COW16_04595 [Sphingomonadales bacterium CG12_big_fil_rev_8_21_14_0_65_65_10]|jgi:hypothetical protein|nr:MAG: hypothetical protein COW16_04595 [Sphingomonadales bacterium CG12_big_fil_rev_8_21_14_0_65_65_10]
MEADFDADDLAKSLYAFRNDVMFYLTDQVPLPDYLSVPLWEGLKRVQRALIELEKRHDCQEQGQVSIGIGLGRELPGSIPWWEEPDSPSESGE